MSHSAVWCVRMLVAYLFNVSLQSGILHGIVTNHIAPTHLPAATCNKTKLSAMHVDPTVVHRSCVCVCVFAGNLDSKDE